MSSLVSHPYLTSYISTALTLVDICCKLYPCQTKSSGWALSILVKLVQGDWICCNGVAYIDLLGGTASSCSSRYVFPNIWLVVNNLKVVTAWNQLRHQFGEELFIALMFQMWEDTFLKRLGTPSCSSTNYWLHQFARLDCVILLMKVS